MKKTRNDSGLSTMAALIILGMVLLVLGATAYFGFRFYIRSEQPRTALKSVKLKKELLEFTHGQIREVYQQIIRLDDVIFLIDDEIKRLEKIAKQFPDQKPIVESERGNLTAEREKLAQALSSVIKDIEAIYVTFLVNQASGIQRVNQNRGSLKERCDKALSNSSKLIFRLEAGKPQSPLEMIKKMIR
jgi:CRISPR/Cas system CSM-associated protein Csm2 small subunit